MSYLVRWLPNALLGVQKAYRFLAEKDADTAKLMASTVLECAEILEKFPNIGKPALDLEPEHRELIIPFGASGYIIIYQINGNEISILSLKHQKEAGY